MKSSLFPADDNSFDGRVNLRIGPGVIVLIILPRPTVWAEAGQEGPRQVKADTRAAKRNDTTSIERIACRDRNVRSTATDEEAGESIY